jgi:hypothetical protein
MAKVKANNAPPGPPPYQMPAVEIGDSVLWHDSQGAAPTAMALVTAVGSDNVTLAVLGEGYHNFIVKTGVRHQDHPDKRLIEQTDSGVWSHRPGLLTLLERLEAALELLAEASAQGGEPTEAPPT